MRIGVEFNWYSGEQWTLLLLHLVEIIEPGYVYLIFLGVARFRLGITLERVGYVW